MLDDLLTCIKNIPRPSTPVVAPLKVGVCILTIAQIAIGAVYLKECPRQPYIPIYLIVAGSFSLLIGFFSCLPCAEERKGVQRNNWYTLCIFWNFITCLFVFAWFIEGTVWIYLIYQPNYNKNATDIDSYCNKTLYLFAFWTTTLVYILLGLVFLIGFFFVFYKRMDSPQNARENV